MGSTPQYLPGASGMGSNGSPQYSSPQSSVPGAQSLVDQFMQSYNPATQPALPNNALYNQAFGNLPPAALQALNYNLANNPYMQASGAQMQQTPAGTPQLPQTTGPSAWASPWQRQRYSQGIAGGAMPWRGWGGRPPPWAPQSAATQGGGPMYAQGQHGAARGGVARLDAGGQVPWYERAEARSIGSPGGLVNSAVPGRTDQLPMTVAGHSYVVPADIVSGIGQGNTMAGAKILDSLLKTGPYNSTYQPGGHHGSTIPSPYHMPLQPWQAVGGVVGHHDSGTPVVVAGGEYVVPPEIVLRLGRGNMRKGHEILDRMVKKVRLQIVAHTKQLPGPKK